MSGLLPEKASVSRGLGPYVGEADVVDFEPGSALPSHWVHWRALFDVNDFAVSPEGFENTLRLTASRANLTTDTKFNTSTEGVTAVFRRQAHTIFNFTADVRLGFGKSAEDEVGVSNFGTPNQHVDVGVAYLEDTSDSGHNLKPYLRLRAYSVNNSTVPRPTLVSVPSEWLAAEDCATPQSCPAAVVRLRITSINESLYEAFAALADRDVTEISIGTYSTALLSGDGAGTGGVLGVYATTNGAGDPFYGYVSRWRYMPIGQKIDNNMTVSCEF